MHGALKPLECHRIQQALSFHAAMWQYNAITWCQTEGKTAAREIWPLKQLTSSRFPSPISGKTWDTWERFALQIILDLEYRFTLESLPNSQTFPRKVCINWKTHYVSFHIVHMSCDKRSLKASVHRIKAVDENMINPARLMGGCSAAVEKAELPSFPLIKYNNGMCLVLITEMQFLVCV